MDIYCGSSNCLPNSSQYVGQNQVTDLLHFILRAITLGMYGNRGRESIFLKNSQNSFLAFCLGIVKDLVHLIALSIEKSKVWLENFMISFSNKYSIKESINHWKDLYWKSAETLKEYHPRNLFRAGGVLDFSQSYDESLRNAGIKIGQGLSDALVNLLQQSKPHFQRHVSSVQDEVLGLAGMAGNRVGAGLLEGTYRQLLLIAKNFILIATPLMVIIAFVKFVQRIFFEKNEVSILYIHNMK